MNLPYYVLYGALGSYDESGYPRVMLSTWEALGLRSRPPLGLQYGSKDTPVVLMNRTIGES